MHLSHRKMTGDVLPNRMSLAQGMQQPTPHQNAINKGHHAISSCVLHDHNPAYLSSPRPNRDGEHFLSKQVDQFKTSSAVQPAETLRYA